MKTQVLKMTNPKTFTVIYDDSRTAATRYALYYHVWKPNSNGVYTKRKYLVDRVWSMDECLAWIMDINRDERCLKNSYCAKRFAV